MKNYPMFKITDDVIEELNYNGATFVSLGEVMIRDTPADLERPERTRLVHLSMAGSEFTLAIGLSRLGISSSYITRVPFNPYGCAVRNVAREHGVNVDHFVWAAKTEPIGRFIYEIGRTPRKNIGIYQRMFSAASRLGNGMVDWDKALRSARLLHVSGITFGLANHSNYERNHCYEAYMEAMKSKPANCSVGLDLNYRATLWSKDMAREVMTPILVDTVDILITTIEDMAKIYGFNCGKYSAKEIVDGNMGTIADEDIQKFAEKVLKEFNVQILGITIRYPDSFENHRWESAAIDKEGTFVRSSHISNITLGDRLGGGDTWNAGFYYGLLTEGFGEAGMTKGVNVGDAATRLKQTTMFDLPILDKAEIEGLMRADVEGGGKRTSR